MKSIGKYLIASVVLLSLGSLGFNGLFKIEPAHVEGTDPKLDKIRLQPGFKIEHLISPSDENMGSWVSMTFDDKGRMICSDQYGGLYRLTIPAAGAASVKPQIEKLKFGKGVDTLGIGNAHGMLYAFNSLYVMVNARATKPGASGRAPGSSFTPRGSGLYRVQDLEIIPMSLQWTPIACLKIGKKIIFSR
jgi:hypothetical protein